MLKKKRTLSLEDRKAVDFVLDPPAGSSKITRIASGVSPKRIARVSELLHHLDNMPEISPPRNLVAMTMAYIDRETVAQSLTEPRVSLPGAVQTHLH